jgi:hypothetical protein
MTKDRDQVFDVSSVGKLYRKSLFLFANHFEDDSGRTIELEDLAVNQRFYVYFISGTGLTKTSAKRIA